MITILQGHGRKDKPERIYGRMFLESGSRMIMVNHEPHVEHQKVTLSELHHIIVFGAFQGEKRALSSNDVG